MARPKIKSKTDESVELALSRLTEQYIYLLFGRHKVRDEKLFRLLSRHRDELYAFFGFDLMTETDRPKPRRISVRSKSQPLPLADQGKAEG